MTQATVSFQMRVVTNFQRIEPIERPYEAWHVYIGPWRLGKLTRHPEEGYQFEVWGSGTVRFATWEAFSESLGKSAMEGPLRHAKDPLP